MIDVIIPVYNSRNTLFKTLSSVALQSISDKVVLHIVDDCSDDIYEDIISQFNKELKIKYYKLNKNSGPGVAREFALKKSKSEYVVFLDSDDLFYNCYSLEKLYEKIIVGNDYVVGKVFNEHTNKTSYSYGDLHGKLYRRSFLEDKNVFFPISRVHEDNFFNSLVRVNSPITSYVWETVYVYCENELSISSVSNEVQFQRLKVWFENVDLILEYAFKNKCNSICIKQIIYEKTRYLCDIYKNLFVDKKEKLRKMVDNSVLDSKYLEFTDYDLLKEDIFNENLDKYICYFSF